MSNFNLLYPTCATSDVIVGFDTIFEKFYICRIPHGVEIHHYESYVSWTVFTSNSIINGTII